MEGSFSVTLEIGNEAMQDGEDVALVLEEICVRLRDGYTGGSVADVNGNTVGSWDLVTS